jgi:hypothetical protein
MLDDAGYHGLSTGRQSNYPLPVLITLLRRAASGPRSNRVRREKQHA